MKEDNLKHEELAGEEALRESRINDSRSFHELTDAIDAVSPIKGSQVLYSADELLGIINEVRAGSLEIHYVTSTLGLRQKVAMLLETDKSLPANETKPEEALNNFSHLGGKEWVDFRDDAVYQKTLSRLISITFTEENRKNPLRVAPRSLPFTLSQFENFLDSNLNEEALMLTINDLVSRQQRELDQLRRMPVPQDDMERFDLRNRIKSVEVSLESLENIRNNNNGVLNELVELLYSADN